VSAFSGENSTYESVVVVLSVDLRRRDGVAVAAEDSDHCPFVAATQDQLKLTAS